MAKKPILVDVDLNQNELQNAVVQNLATVPANVKAGQLWYNTTDGLLYTGNKAVGAPITKSDIGLGNVDNTSDADKPISTATQAALDLKLPTSTKYGASLSLTMNSSTYVITAQLKDQSGENLGTAATIDLPLETVVVSGSYDATNKKVVLTLKDGSTVDFSVADLIDGLQNEITSDNKLNADSVDDTSAAHKFITAAERTTWNAAAQKLTATNPALTPSSGVATWTVAHSLGADVIASVRDASGNEVFADITYGASNVVIKMNATANIAAGKYKVVVIG